MSSDPDPFSRVGIVGGGPIEAGIAEVCLRADLDVKLVDLDALDSLRGAIMAGDLMQANSRPVD